MQCWFWGPLFLAAAVFQLVCCVNVNAFASGSPSHSPHHEPTSTGILASQAILWTRKIRTCGSNVTKCLDLLYQIPGSLSSSAASFSATEVQALGAAVSGDGTEITKSTNPIHHHKTLEPVYLEALTVINQAQKKRKGDPDHLLRQALCLHEMCPTEPMRARTISLCGQHGGPVGVELALTLLYHRGERLRSVSSVKAALAVCSQARKWREALRILHHHQDAVPTVSTLSCNIVLTAMERAKQGNTAMDLLLRMLVDHMPAPPDCGSFHRVMNALIASEHREETDVKQETCQVDAAYNLIGKMVAHSISPNNATFDLLVSAYGRVNDWDMAALVDNLRASRNEDASFLNATQLRKSRGCPFDRDNSTSRGTANLNLYWENDGHGMKKVGRGKFAHWEFASYSDPVSNISLTVALQPHRNPSKNGIKIVLIDRDSPEKLKVGFLLMINSAKDNTSTLLGVFLNPSIRKYGLSKVVLAIWMDLRRRADISPRTGVINKPLLALVLQGTFGFVPESYQRPGVLVEISPGTSSSSTVELYAPSIKSLQGVFGSWDLERERIRLVSCPPVPRGRSCRVGTTWMLTESSSTSVMDAVARELVGRNGRGIVYRSEDIAWRRIFLGNQA